MADRVATLSHLASLAILTLPITWSVAQLLAGTNDFSLIALAIVGPFFAIGVAGLVAWVRAGKRQALVVYDIATGSMGIQALTSVLEPVRLVGMGLLCVTAIGLVALAGHRPAR